MSTCDAIREDFEEPLEEEIKVLKKSIDIFSGEETLTVQVCTKYNRIPFSVPRDEFTKKSFFNKLTLHGLSVVEDDDAYQTLRQELDTAESQAPVVFTHNIVGFTELEGKKCFCGYHPIGDLTSKQLSSENKEWEKILKPQGSFEVWRNFIRKHIVGNTERSIILMLGATAPIAYILKEEGLFPDVALYSLIQDTSKGKTSSLYLISSLMCNPRYFIENFHATPGALYAMLQERNGLIFLCDEATHTPHIDWSEMLYTLPTGKEKRRLNNQGKLKPIVEFGGSIVMTSEESILSRSSGHGGEAARIMEFSFSCFDKEPWLTEKIRELTFSNYGWVTEPLAKLLLDEKEKTKLIKKFKKYYKRMLCDVKGDIAGVDRRLFQRSALIATSGYLLRKATQCNFNIDGVIDYLVHHIEALKASRDDRDKADKLLDEIMSFVSSHRNMFPSYESLLPSATGRAKHYGAFWGATGYYKCKACVWISEEVLKNHILPQQMKNPTQTMQSLVKKNFAEKFYDRYYYKKQNFGGITANYCCIFLPETQNLIMKIENVSEANMSIQNLNAYIAEDYDLNEYKFMNAVKELPSLTITNAAVNTFAITVNGLFQAKMSMGRKCTLFATPITQQQTLLLSKKKIVNNSFSLSFTESGKGSVTIGLEVFNLLSLLECNLPKGYKLVSTAIEFTEKNDNLIANINFDVNVVSITPDDNPPVDYIVSSVKERGNYRNRNLLMSDDEEEI